MSITLNPWKPPISIGWCLRKITWTISSHGSSSSLEAEERITNYDDTWRPTMNTLIVFASQHGCTENCALRLKEGIHGNIDLIDLKTKPGVELDRYDTVLIGGSIHAGRIQKSVKKYCERNGRELLTKKIGLFLCCMEEGDRAKQQFEDAFPEDLRAHASAVGMFGGAFDLDRMNAVERIIVKKVAKVESNVSKINEEAISEFIKTIGG